MNIHPIQPLFEEDGRLRFKKNAIVEYLLDNGGIDMNKLAMLDFSAEDREQFAQLIGYSLNGFAELSYVRVETLAAAVVMAESVQLEVKNGGLRDELKALKAVLREPVARLFGIHPDDLGTDE